MIHEYINKTITIATCCKNSERFIKKFLDLCISISKFFKDFKIIIYENNSSDDTLKIIYNWLNLNNIYSKVKLISENLDRHDTNAKHIIISHARNKILDYVKNNRTDLLLILDCDEVTINSIFYDNFINTLNTLSYDYWDVIFPNQLNYYYDKWALRIPNTFLDIDWKKLNTDYNLIIPYNFNKIIKVKSAFGGAGLYKVNIIKNCCNYSPFDKKNIGFRCEHVSFHKCLYKHDAKMYIVPNFINCESDLKILNKQYPTIFIEELYK
jgi:hypothetical protein